MSLCVIGIINFSETEACSARRSSSGSENKNPLSCEQQRRKKGRPRF